MDSTVTQLVFIDDDDPGILYQGDWAVSRGESTELQSLTYPESPRTPWYGTVHTQSSTGGLSYIFDGTAFSVFFLTFDAQTITSCTVDGIQQHVEASIQGVECRNNDTLAAAKHNLSLTLNAFDRPFEVVSSQIPFDGLFYTPSKFPDSGVDVAFQSTLLPNERRDIIGNTFDFQFNGISIGIYCLIGFKSTNISSFSYFVDEGPALSFTIANPSTTLSEVAVDFQLIVQTPHLSPGLHTIHVTGFNDQDSDVDIIPRQFIVQNTSRPTALDAVPAVSSDISSIFPASLTSRSQEGTSTQHGIIPIPNSTASPTLIITSTVSSSSPVSGSHATAHIKSGIIVAIALSISAALVIALLILACFRRSRIKRIADSQSRRDLMLPFDPPDPIQAGRFRLPQYITQEKTEKYRQALGISNPYPPDQRSGLQPPEQMREELHQPHGIRYRVHEDGGELETLEDEEEVVDLPPVYGTFGNQGQPR